MKKVVIALVACLMLSNVAFAQQQTDKQKEMAKGQTLFYLGLGVAATGLTPLFMGTSKSVSIGLPIVAGGGVLAYYGYQKKQKAQKMALGIVPVKKGVAIAFVRTW